IRERLERLMQRLADRRAQQPPVAPHLAEAPDRSSPPPREAMTTYAYNGEGTLFLPDPPTARELAPEDSSTADDRRASREAAGQSAEQVLQLGASEPHTQQPGRGKGLTMEERIDAPEARPCKVSLCLIVRDAETTLAACLRS